MRKVIIEGTSLVNGGSTPAVDLPSMVFDSMGIRLSQNSTTNKLLIANLGKLWVRMTVKIPGLTVKVVDAKFIDLMHRTNYKMGYPGSDTEFEYQVFLALGTLNPSEVIEGSISFYLETITTLDSAPKVDVELFHADRGRDNPVRGYESITITGQQTLQNVYELYQITDPSNRVIKIKDPYEGDIQYNDTLSKAWSKCLGQYEANTAIPFSYFDNTGESTTIQITTPTTLDFLLVSRK